MTINQIIQIIDLLVGDVVSYDESGWECKFDKEAKETIINALEKQMPKKPKGDYHSVPHWRCPTCNSAVVLYEDSFKKAFCEWCGQALDWRKE